MGWASYAEDVDDRHNENRHTVNARPPVSVEPAHPTGNPPRKGPRKASKIGRFFAPAANPKPDLAASTAKELQETVSRQRNRIAALEKDNRDLLRIVHRLKNERQVLATELDLSGSRLGRNVRKAPKNPKARIVKERTTRHAGRRAG